MSTNEDLTRLQENLIDWDKAIRGERTYDLLPPRPNMGFPRLPPDTDEQIIKKLVAGNIELVYGIGEFPVGMAFPKKDQKSVLPCSIERTQKISIQTWLKNTRKESF